ncbi:MAG: GntR family transcriptional regulator [Oscillospiraceae bacterium]|nr:GntR family transcriptional regulator [Oscillospiraceae bacterium]
MDIIIRNADGEPIYQQIVTQIKRMILDGELQAGDALPSMRVLAQQLRISVITTKRAYEELERDGMIESFTGKGSFIKAQNPELLLEESLRQIEAQLTTAVEKAKQSKISLAELQEMLELLYGTDET